MNQIIERLYVKNYWECDFKNRKNFILKHVESHIPERRRQKTGSKRKPRIDSKVYYLMSKLNTRVRVCKDFFTKTLCISRDVIEHTFKHKGEGSFYSTEDKRGKKEPYNKTKFEDIRNVKMHIEHFQCIESKLITESGNAVIVDCKQNIPNMYNDYKEMCDKVGSKPVSLAMYRKIYYKDYN